MPRYHFDRIDGVSEPDLEGFDLTGPEEAKHEAVRFAADTLKDLSRDDWAGGIVRIELTDSEHALLFTVLISAEPALEHACRDQAC